MMLLVSKGLGTLMKYPPRNVGRLVVPRSMGRVADTPRAGFLWAADNDAFNGFHEGRYLRMLDKSAGVPGCLFVACPDVVGDAEATFRLYLKWAKPILDRGLPLGYVIQNGALDYPIPWDGLTAVFIGGDDEWKYSPDVRRIVREARERGRWVHMGRVNSWRRIEYANAIGCDSTDGTSLSMFTDTYLSRFSEMAASPGQSVLEVSL